MTSNFDEFVANFFHVTLEDQYLTDWLINNGDFLLRQSGENFVLCTNYNGTISQITLEKNSTSKYGFGDNVFDNLADLLKFHISTGHSINNVVIKEGIPHRSKIFQNSDIFVGKKIGKGNFGSVNMVRVISENKQYAMKTLNEPVTEDQISEFFSELKFMSQFNHDHVVKSFGHINDPPRQKMVLELMNYQSVEKQLKKGNLSMERKQLIMVHVADAMAYIHKRNVIHRDLAGRNILLYQNTDKSIVAKVSDFGISRSDPSGTGYTLEKDENLPLKIMAPESFKDDKWYKSTDVWAYGCFMKEIIGNGKDIYDLRFEDANWKANLCEFVIDGGRPTDIVHPKAEIIQLARNCWMTNHGDRPTMAIIYETLKTAFYPEPEKRENENA